MTNIFQNSVWPHTPFYFPMNTFDHTSNLQDRSAIFIFDPSVDVLYSQAWLDLEEHPIVLNIPDIPKQVCSYIRGVIKGQEKSLPVFSRSIHRYEIYGTRYMGPCMAVKLAASNFFVFTPD